MRFADVMAADKRDKEATPAASWLLDQILAEQPTSSSNMDRFRLYFFAFLCFIPSSQASEYNLCATSEYDRLCKLIEASTKEVTCVPVSDSVDCLLKMLKGEAHFGTFYAEEAFLAERFLGNSGAVVAEVRHPDRENAAFNFETVVVAKKTLLGGLKTLKGSSYCHPGFGKARYWSDRVLKDFEKKILDTFKDEMKCNSSALSAYEDDLFRLSQIFHKACRPGTWAVSDWWDKKLKREYQGLCQQCEHPSTCSYNVQNKGRHSDALRCLTLQGGDVAYTALEFVREYFGLDSEDDELGPEHKNPSRYNFLCPDGTTLPLTASEPCSWIRQPWTSVVALKTTSAQLLNDLKVWLAGESDNPWTKHLAGILGKGNGVLKFRERLPTVAAYISEGRTIPSADAESCRSAVKWCTIGATEKKKCEYISTAALTHGLPTRLRCIQGNSKFDCLRKIREREADVVYIDTELGFISRKVYNLTVAAYLETQRTGNYYGMLVVKGDSIKKFKDLRGKKACFPQYNGLGWLTYVEALKSKAIISRRSCSNSNKVWTHFSKVCAPGAKDHNVNPQWRKAPEVLCKGCTNTNEGSSCEATDKNPYYGEVGALKCLNNGDGDVAFLDYHTIRKYFATNSQDTKIKQEDFKILCRDGTVENFSSADPDKCSFTQINGGEVVTRNDLEGTEKSDITNTLLELDDLFGTTSRAYNPSLKMYEPFDGETNVLFKESAVLLVTETQNHFVKNYIKLLTETENCSDDNGSSITLPSILVLIFSIICIFNQN